MKHIIISVFVLLLGLSFVSSAQAQVKDKKIVAEKVTEGKPVNTVCPVTGEGLENNSVTATYEGKTYALCCKSCLKKFKKESTKYIGNLSEDGNKFVKQKTK